MSHQLKNYLSHMKFKNLVIHNKKKLQVKDGITIVKINFSPLDCQLCGPPKGKLLWCKHIYLLYKEIYKHSNEDISLIAHDKKYIDLNLQFKEECYILF